MNLSKLLDELSNLKSLGYTNEEALAWVSSHYDISEVFDVVKYLDQEKEAA